MGDGVVRDRDYPVAGGKILFFFVSPSPEEAPKALITLRDGQGVRNREIEFDFSTIAVKNRLSQGNIVTKFKVQKVSKAPSRAS